MQLTWDAINHDWRRNVVGFNYDKQRSLWRELRLDRLTHWQYAAMIAALASLWIGLLLAWLLWRRRQHEPCPHALECVMRPACERRIASLASRKDRLPTRPGPRSAGRSSPPVFG